MNNVLDTVTDNIIIRPCETFQELTACVELQIEVWGYSDGDVIPRRVFIVTRRIGGQVFGAFDLNLCRGFVERGCRNSHRIRDGTPRYT